MKITNVVIFAFLLVSIIASLGVIGYNFNTSIGQLQELSLNHLETAAQSRSEHIETYLDQHIELLEAVTSRTKLRNTLYNYNQNPNEEDIEIINGIITDAISPMDEIERICIINLDGIVLSSTNENFCGVDVSEKEFFIGGIQTEGIYFIEEEEELKIFVAGPLLLNGETIGMGITVLKANVLEDIIRDRSGLGETGEVLVAIKEGDEIFYLFERLFEYNFTLSDIEDEDLIVAEPMIEALKGNELLFEDSLDYRGEPVLAVSQFVEEYGLGLVAKKDISEAIEEEEDNLIRSALFSLFFLILFVSIFGYLTSRWISKPLKDLTNNVEDITKGNFNIRLEKSNISEINSLTDSLNRILASLKLAILRTGLSKKELGLGEALKAKEEAEKKLSISKEIYNSLFQNMNSGVVVYSAIDGGKDFIIKDLNARSQEIDRIKKEKVIGKKVTKVFPGIKKMGLLDVLRKVYKSGKPMSFPISYYEDPKNKGWRENYVYKLSTGEVVAVYEDVTKEMEYKTNLQKTKLRYQKILENTEDLIYSYDSKGVITYSSKNCSMWGYKAKEVVGKNITFFIHPKDKKRALADFKKSMSTGASFPTEFRLKRKDGSYAYVEEFSKIILEKGKFKEGNGIIRDITKRKEAEKKVQENEKKYRALFENSNDPIIIHDLKGKILNVNKSVCKLFNLPKSICIKKSLLKIHPKEDLKIARKAIKETKQKGRTRFKIRVNVKGKKPKLVEISSAIVDPEKGIVQGILREVKK